MYQFMPTSPTINIIAVPDIQMPCGRSCKHPLFRLHGACLKHFIVYKSRHLYPFPRICQKIIILPDGKKINAYRDFLSHPTTDFRKFFIGQITHLTIIFCQNTVIFKDHKKTVCLWYLFVIFITKMHRKYILNHCIFLLYLHLF